MDRWTTMDRWTMMKLQKDVERGLASPGQVARYEAELARRAALAAFDEVGHPGHPVTCRRRCCGHPRGRR